MDKPLATILRPTTVNDIIGQSHLINDKNGIINRILNQKFLTSLIFYGNPGTGKTTIAQALANDLKCEFGVFNAAIDKKENLEKLIKIAQNTKPYIIIIEEIQRMNRDRQDLLLQYLEHGNFILMACTTENPYFVINPALRSRCLLLELKPISNEEMLLGLKKIITNNSFFNFNISDEILEKICNLATGDLRIAINILEILIKLYPNEIITIDIINAIMPKASNWNAKEGNEHHDLKSALQKSIRGSDVNAALHYLARLLATGDYESLLRRMLIIVYEDIGLANPALAIRVKTAIDTFRQIGMPEGIIPLGLVVIEMALSEKSNSANLAVQKAYSDVLQGKIYPIPDYLKHNWSKTLKKSVGKGKLYKFPHDYANDYVQQQYLPTKLKDTKYYQPKLHNIYEKKLNEIYNRFTKK
ncbi:replication-associated recombination protein A [Spiroplasma endosymbiont of Dasysyrphus albostriatus]|uniref:replication-associated recombination protein A n=1 Tax=Spiroplasma endosymbiont of Dasysyrphus albostriatus TaxID=3066299 RepID=UPI0030D55562